MANIIRRLATSTLIKSHRSRATLPPLLVRLQSTSARPTDSNQTVQDVRTKLVELMGIERGYQTLPKSREHLLQYLPKSQNDLPVRKMSDSFDCAIIPLSKNVELQEKYIAYLGHIRYGRLMEDMDIFAGYIACRHVCNPALPAGTPTPYILVTPAVDQIDFVGPDIKVFASNDTKQKYDQVIVQRAIRPYIQTLPELFLSVVWCAVKHIDNVNQIPDTPTPYNIVTVLVDQIDFTDFIPKPDADIRLSGHVCWVGKSSVEVVVWLEQESHGSWQKITRALFLMAARNSTNSGSAVVNALEAETEEEKRILLGGEERKVRRQQLLKTSLLKTVPNATEQQLIHDLFMRTADPQDPTLFRRVLPPRCMWMTDAQLDNIIFCHPEDRNLHNKVFGGFLMRHALELSWSAGYLHCKHRPKLLHISDIGFHRPVDVGSLLKMHSHVTYTERNFMQIVVYADVYDPHTGLNNTTNMFHYTYQSPEPVAPVIPNSYHEAMMYIDARRHFQHVMGLTPKNC